MNAESFGIVLRVFNDDRVEICDAQPLPGTTLPTPADDDGDYTLAFLDERGTPIGESGFPVSFQTPHLDRLLPSATVGIVRPLPERTAAVEVRHKGVSRARLNRSPIPPTLSSVAVVRPAPLGSDDLEVSWSGEASEGSSLTFAVSYSTDGGGSFQPIRAGLRQSTLRVPLAGLPGSRRGVFRVVASDGFATAEATSEPFSIPNKPTCAAIISPAQEARFEIGEPIMLAGVAFDPQAGMLAGDALEWWLAYGEAEVQLGAGSEVALSQVPSGRHLIRLVASGPSGQRGVDKREIEIATPPALPQQLTVARVRAADVTLVFSHTGRVTVSDSRADIKLEDSSGTGFLQSRLWPRGEDDTAGAGLIAYLYRIDLSSTTGDGAVSALSLHMGNIEPLLYAGEVSSPADVFVIEEGGLGTVAPSNVIRLAATVTFSFDPPVASGQSSFFIGLASGGEPRDDEAEIVEPDGARHTVVAQVPKGIPGEQQ